MIEEAHSVDFTSLSLPHVDPWSRFPVCPKCGASLGAGIWLLALYRQSKGEASQRYGYCRGDQNSSVKAPGLRFDNDGPVPILTDVQVPCFGVIEEHLHVICGRCNYAWLMAVKGTNGKPQD